MPSPKARAVTFDLMMSFQRFYGLGEEVHESTLARIPEDMYRMPDIARARGEGVVNG